MACHHQCLPQDRGSYSTPTDSVPSCDGDLLLLLYAYRSNIMIAYGEHMLPPVLTATALPRKLVYKGNV